MWQALSDRAAGLAQGLPPQALKTSLLSDTPTRTDSPDDHDSGLLYGHLGVAWALSRFLNTGPAIIGDACTQALRAELGRYITVDEGRALLLNQKSRTIPYLAMGSAGFGIVLPGIPRNLWPVGKSRKAFPHSPLHATRTGASSPDCSTAWPDCSSGVPVSSTPQG